MTGFHAVGVASVLGHRCTDDHDHDLQQSCNETEFIRQVSKQASK